MGGLLDPSWHYFEEKIREWLVLVVQLFPVDSASFQAIDADDDDDDDYELCLGVICFDRAGYHVAVTAVGQSVNSKHLVGTRTRGRARKNATIF